jgi:hypothetical protein
LADALKIQLIDFTQLLMNCEDSFDVFKYDSPDITHLRKKVHFRTDNSDHIMKTGVITNFYLLIISLNEKQEENIHAKGFSQGNEISIHVIISWPMLRALFN